MRTSVLRHLLGSVRVRTTVAAAVIVSLALGAGSFALMAVLENRLTDALDATAQTRADDLASLAAQGPLPQTLTFPGSDVPVVQVVRRGVVIASTANAARLPVITAAEPTDLTVSRLDGRRVDDPGSIFLLVARPATTADGPISIYVARDLDAVERSTEALRNALAVACPLLVLVVAATTWLIVGRALDPVESIRSQVADISSTDLHRRLTEPAGDDEIARLARTMNELLGRLEAGADRQQRFVADASHELQSPLATIRAEAELALRSAEPTSAWAEAATSILAEQDRMARLVQNLLVLARGDQARADLPPPRLFDLDEVVGSEVARLRPRTTLRLDMAGVSAAAVRGSADEVGQLVANLLDNASRYAATTVAVSLSQADDGLATLVVDDDGPGIPETDRSRVFDRFARLGASRSVDEGGTGLGLAIVRQIAQRHSADVRVTTAPLGGARFEVRFPQP